MKGGTTTATATVDPFVETEDFFAQARHAQSAVTKQQHERQFDKTDNDLLGLDNLHVTANVNENVTNANDNSNIADGSSWHNELLNLNYQPPPTADLLGFTQPTTCDTTNATCNDVNNSTSSTKGMPQSEETSSNSNANELLSLEYTPSNTAAMKLNDAYVALEQMRVANLQIELAAAGSGTGNNNSNLYNFKINTHKCVLCLRNEITLKKRKVSYFGNSFRFQKDKPCLMCGSPTCKKHSDVGFLKSKIAICMECSPFFSLDFIIECVCLNIAAETEDDEHDENDEDNRDNNNNHDNNDRDNNHDGNNNMVQNEIGQIIGDQHTATVHTHHVSTSSQSNTTATTTTTANVTQTTPNFNRTTSPTSPLSLPPISPKEKLRRQNIKHMVDVYDRVHLMLTYSAQFIEEIALKLETNTKRDDRVGISSNSIGIASGLAGIAAAAAVVTPAGPPLIIASLLFGATAQASSSGSKVVNYYSAPNKIALKIISYYNLLKSILVVTSVLKDALLNGDINMEQYVSHMVKAHDEAMMKLYDTKDGTDNDNDNTNQQEQQGEEKKVDWDKVEDLTHMAQQGINQQQQQSVGGDMNMVDHEDDSETTDEFGDFQEADSTDIDSIPSMPSMSPPKPKKSSSSSEPITETTEKDKDVQQKAVENDGGLMERKNTAGKLARFYSRTSLAGSSLVGAATVTVFAGAALSLAHVAFEANNFASTIKRLQAGSPSKRALVLRNIKDDIMNLPNTAVIAEEWDKYLATLDERRKNVMKANVN